VDEYHRVLRTLTYINSRPNPTRDTRIIVGSVLDGRLTSQPAFISIAINADNNAPALDLNGELIPGAAFETIFIQGGSPVPIASDVLTVTDYENDLVHSAAVSISPLLDSPSEKLEITLPSPIVRNAVVAGTALLNKFIFGSCVHTLTSFCVDDTITLSGSDVITDVAVVLEVDHPYVGDLLISLSHAGRTVSLLSNIPDSLGRVGRCATANFANVLIQDGATDRMDVTCTPNAAGVFKPEDFLSTFSGQSMGGDWTLLVEDSVKSFSTGSLKSWGLIVDAGERSAIQYRPSRAFTSAEPQVEVSIPVSLAGAITDLDVAVHITTDEPHKLALTLEHPDGTSVNLIASQAGCLRKHMTTIFDDSATGPSTGFCNSFSNVMRITPPELLSAFNDKQPTGTWTLVVNNGGGAGTIHAVSFNFVLRKSYNTSSSVSPPA